MPRIYRSAQGQLINLDALVLMNEKTQAVGNMKVNANGDEIDSNGAVIKSKEQKMQEYYNPNQQSAKHHLKGKR